MNGKFYENLPSISPAGGAIIIIMGEDLNVLFKQQFYCVFEDIIDPDNYYTTDVDFTINLCKTNKYDCLQSSLHISYFSNLYQAACIAPIIATGESNEITMELSLFSYNNQKIACSTNSNCHLKVSYDKYAYIKDFNPTHFLLGSLLKFSIRHHKDVKNVLDEIINFKVLYFYK